MVTALFYGRVHGVDLLIARAVLIMVVDDPAGLQVRVYRDRANILETTFFEILADPGGKPIADRDGTDIMTVVENGFAVGVCPDVVAKAAELFAYPLIAPGVIDHGKDLARGADHTLLSQNALDVGVGIACNLVVIEVIKTPTENLTLLQHQIPAEPTLQALQCQVFEHLAVVMDRNAPFGIMILPIFVIYVSPNAVAHSG